MGGLGIAIGGGVSFIEFCHDFHAVFTGFEHHCHELVCAEAVVDGGGKAFHDEFVYIVVLEAEHSSVIAISGNTFDAIGDGFAQAANVFILGSENTDFCGKICVFIFGNIEMDSFGISFADCFIIDEGAKFFLAGVSELNGFFDESDEDIL